LSQVKSEDFIFEIGTEELPASFVEPAIRSLKGQFEEFLKEFYLCADSVEVFGTPRRLILLATGIPNKGDDKEEVITGPSWRAAFDEKGNPTKAALGFARSKEIDVEELCRIDTDRGPYVGFRRVVEGMETCELLEKKLPEIIKKIPFKKSMRWGSGSLKFGRPINWICALFGKRVISFVLDKVKVDKYSYGHRFLAPESFDVSAVDDFIDELESRFVIVDIERRKTIIIDGAKTLADSVGGVLAEDEDLFEEIANLVEYPYPVLGSFNKEFLQLPEEVPITVMKEHQRYFSVKDRSGKLKNFFVAVSNIKPPDEALIRQGYEKVLRARLADAMFFFREDRKRSLAERVEELKGVVFHDKLGSMFQKVERLKLLVPEIAKYIGGSTKKVERAAFLSKADLVTEMVKEFTELQGVMGKNYALLDGEDREVAEAIFEQYLPRFSGDILPETETGVTISIAEKIDNLVGFLGVGFKPSGSADPFALRRNGIGLVKIITEKSIFLNLYDLLLCSFKLYEEQGVNLSEGTSDEILEFIKERLKFLLSGQFATDVIDAVLYVTNDLADGVERIKAIEEIRGNSEFEEVLTTMRRVMNIIPEGFEPIVVGHTDNEYEKQLLEAFARVKVKIENFIRERDYKKALLVIKELKNSVDTFFDNLMIMDKDEEVKDRRLSILYEISKTISRFADFRKIR